MEFVRGAVRFGGALHRALPGLCKLGHLCHRNLLQLPSLKLCKYVVQDKLWRVCNTGAWPRGHERAGVKALDAYHPIKSKVRVWS